MTKPTANRTWLAAMAAVLCSAVAAHAESGALGKAPGWQPPAAERVREEAFAWLDGEQVDAAILEKAESLWSPPEHEPPAAELLERLAATFALVDDEARRLVELCQGARKGAALPDFPRLADEETPPLVANNLRLLYGRWLASERLFDEAREQLAGLEPAGVVDPASLLFYRAVVEHRLVKRDAALEAIEQLLAGSSQSPVRYVAVAGLMQADLKRLEEDTLDHIARRMEDIERRLALGRAGSKVRQVEDGVVESLDKLIQELEEKQQSASGGAQLQSSNPAQDSRILGGKGPGDVTKRGIGSESGWGNLPPKEREQAMQEIGREFPSHYRDAIEQYFRRLAGRRSEGE